MFLTAAQRRLLTVSGLLAAGFVLGLAMQSPSIQTALLGLKEDRPAQTRAAALNTPVAEPSATAARQVGCADQGSGACRVHESYLRSTEKPNAGLTLGARREQAMQGQTIAPGPGARLITVYNGSTAKQYVVAREAD